MIQRDMEATLSRLAAQFPVIAIMGPRQSGKTTLARSFFRGYGYVNLEDPNLRRMAMEDGASFLRMHPAPLVLDEVQRVPELLSFLQVEVDRNPKRKAAYVLTGSHQPKLREGIAQTLAGRIGIANLLPFSISELKRGGVPLDRDELLFQGFMPRIYDEGANPLDLYANYLATYVERDVGQMIQLKDRRVFEIFLRLLAGRVGQVVNYESLAGDVGVSAVTVKNWLSILEASFIVQLLPCYYRNYGKRFIKAPKVYFTEVGLASYLLSLEGPAQVARDPLLGGLFENMVVMDLFKTRANQGLSPNLYFIRDSRGVEADVVLERNRRLDLFEVKSARTFSTDFAANLRKIRDYVPDVRRSAVVYSGETRLGGDTDYVHFADLGLIPAEPDATPASGKDLS